MRLTLKSAFFLLAIIVVFSKFEGAYSKMTAYKVNLPKTLGDWTRPDVPKVIDSKNIFEYMNGAGELYLSYRFHHLEVYEMLRAAKVISW